MAQREGGSHTSAPIGSGEFLFAAVPFPTGSDSTPKIWMIPPEWRFRMRMRRKEVIDMGKIIAVAAAVVAVGAVTVVAKKKK